MSENEEIRKLQQERIEFGKAEKGAGYFAGDISDQNIQYTNVIVDDEDEMDDDDNYSSSSSRGRSTTDSKIREARELMGEGGENESQSLGSRFGSGLTNTKIADRESEVRFYFG